MKTAAKDFKMTELGPIPKDWEVKRVDELAEVGRGRVISQVEIDKSSRHLYPVYSSQTLNNGEMGRIDTYDFDGEYVTWTTDGVNAGRVFYRTGRFNCTNVCGTLKIKEADAKFVAMSLGRQTQSYVATNLANPKLMNGVMKQVPFILPPLPEQRKIAAALSDVDEMIAALEKLIEKKRKIKTGAMQRLLTGKTRLPGFKGAWVEKRLGDVGDFVAGNGFPLRWQGALKGDYPFFKVSDFSNVGNERRMRVANNYISTDVVRILNCCLLPKFSIVFAKIGAAIALERKRLLMQTSCIDNNMMAFIAGDEVCSEFMVELFQEIKFADFSESTALPALNIGRLREVVVSCPPSLAEQKAIAKVLGDIDEEIAALEAELAKTRQLKQGMMQELLTGKTRIKGV